MSFQDIGRKPAAKSTQQQQPSSYRTAVFGSSAAAQPQSNGKTGASVRSTGPAAQQASFNAAADGLSTELKRDQRMEKLSEYLMQYSVSIHRDL